MRKTKDSRWIILTLSVIMLLGGKYCFELPAALKESLSLRLSSYMSLDEYEFFYNSFLSIYSLPNIVLPFLNGYLVDRFGYKLMLILCACLSLGGHTFFAVGLSKNFMELMIGGRFVFGIGCESLVVAQNILLTKYFSQKELSLAMAISATTSSFGTVLNMLVTPRIVADVSIDAAVWIGVIFCLVGVISLLIVLFLDKRNADNYQLARFLLYRKPEYDIIEFELNHFKKFDRIFWYLALTQFFLFSTITCWINIGPSFLVEMWFDHLTVKKAQILAGNSLALVGLVSIITGPLVGYFADTYGLRPRIILTGTIICALSMAMYLFVFPFLPSFLLGVAYAFCSSSIFPCISYVVQHEYLGKANGLVISLQNLGYFIYPYIIAACKVWTGDYRISQVFLMLSGVAAIRFAWRTFKENLKKGYNLELEVDLMDLAGVEVLALRGSQEGRGEELQYNILHSDERISPRKDSNF